MAVSPASRPLPRPARYLLAHLTAYPLAFLWAVASMPLAIHLFIDELGALHDDPTAIGQLVVRRVAWPAGVAFALPHLLALPWALSRAPARLQRPTWLALAGLAAVGLVFGAASWSWIVLRAPV